MQIFLVPVIAMLTVFWISCSVIYWMIKRQLAPIVRSIKKIERNMGSSPTTEEFSPTPRPRPSAPSRYITVERQPRY